MKCFAIIYRVSHFLQSDWGDDPHNPRNNLKKNAEPDVFPSAQPAAIEATVGEACEINEKEPDRVHRHGKHIRKRLVILGSVHAFRIVYVYHYDLVGPDSILGAHGVPNTLYNCVIIQQWTVRV